MRQRLRAYIKRQPIAAFFLLVIAICFGFLFPAVLLMSKEDPVGQVLGLDLARIGAYSPVLAGIFVVRLNQSSRQGVSLAGRLFVFLPAWLVAGLIHGASLKLTVPPEASQLALTVLSMPVALLPALVISMAFSGSDGVKQLLATLIRPKGKAVYYLIALMTFPVIHVVGFAITNTLHSDIWLPRVGHGTDLVFTLFITFISVLLFSGGLNEESGWRGFAQNRLQTDFSPPNSKPDPVFPDGGLAYPERSCRVPRRRIPGGQMTVDQVHVLPPQTASFQKL